MTISLCIMVYHHHVSHISCPSSTHDISPVSSFFLRHVISCDLMSRFWWYMDMIPTHDIMMIYDDITPKSDFELHALHPTWYHMISHDITWYHVPRPQPKPPEHKLWYHDISCSIMNHDTTWYVVIHVMIHEYKNTEMSPRYRMIYDDIRWYEDDW